MIYTDCPPSPLCSPVHPPLPDSGSHSSSHPLHRFTFSRMPRSWWPFSDGLLSLDNKHLSFFLVFSWPNGVFLAHAAEHPTVGTHHNRLIHSCRFSAWSFLF